jgi:hypothetical protein
MRTRPTTGCFLVAALVVPTHRRPPPIYRLQRALRWTAALVFVALVVFAGTVAYSAFEVARASPQSRGLSASFAPNDTIEVSGSFTLSNSGFYPIQGFALTARILDASGGFLGKVGVGPTDVPGASTGEFPISLYFPISASGPATSLLTQDQYLSVDAWANATYAFLFPLSVALTETRAWGAPFVNFQASVGTPSGGGGTLSIPVTVTFSNHANFAEVGTLSFSIVSSNLVTCGGGSFPLDVPPGGLYDQTTNATLSSGCSPSGGELESSYTSGGMTIALPSEPIP